LKSSFCVAPWLPLPTFSGRYQTFFFSPLFVPRSFQISFATPFSMAIFSFFPRGPLLDIFLLFSPPPTYGNGCDLQRGGGPGLLQKNPHPPPPPGFSHFFFSRGFFNPAKSSGIFFFPPPDGPYDHPPHFSPLQNKARGFFTSFPGGRNPLFHFPSLVPPPKGFFFQLVFLLCLVSFPPFQNLRGTLPPWPKSSAFPLFFPCSL